MAKKEKEQINKNTLQHAEVFASYLQDYVIKHKVIHCTILQCKEFCLSLWLWRSLLQLKRSLLSLPELCWELPLRPLQMVCPVEVTSILSSRGEIQKVSWWLLSPLITSHTEIPITAKMVSQLRAKTDSPMMECKKALIEAKGDFDRAEEILRVKLGNKATKVGSRIAAEGATMQPSIIHLYQTYEFNHR